MSPRQLKNLNLNIPEFTINPNQGTIKLLHKDIAEEGPANQRARFSYSDEQHLFLVCLFFAKKETWGGTFVREALPQGTPLKEVHTLCRAYAAMF